MNPMNLSPVQILQFAAAVFPRDAFVLVDGIGQVRIPIVMTAIALRESAGDPRAYNNNAATGDDSRGLYQINRLIWQRDDEAGLKFLGIEKWDDLFDPAIATAAAAKLWGGHNGNLDLAWYIHKDGYRQRFESHLPAAVTAALGLAA